MSTTFRITLLLAAAACLVGGCSMWRHAPEEPSQLPVPRMSPDAVVLEVAILAVPPGPEFSHDQLWRGVDEQHLPLELRRQLAHNGLVCGKIGAQMPEQIQRLLQTNQGQLQFDDAAGMTLSDSSGLQKRLQCRRGARQELPMHAVRPQIDIMLQGDDGRIRGQTYQEAQCLFAWKTFPQPSGGVQLDITPELHYGQPRQRVVRRDFAMQLQPGRDRRLFDQLRIKADLEPGQILLLGATRELKGLGRQFFADIENGGQDRKLLAIRLAQTQFDGLFAPEQIRAPIATPGE